MSNQTIKEQLDYWRRLLPVGSVWLTQQLTCRFVTVKGIRFNIFTNCLVVQYTRDDAPNTVYQEMVGAFYNYIVSKQIK